MINFRYVCLVKSIKRVIEAEDEEVGGIMNEETFTCTNGWSSV